MQNPPVLLIIFNRPDLTEGMMAALSSARPSRLFIAADGPRQHVEGEGEVCNRTRSIALAVDWPCEVRTLLSIRNRGCREMVSSALMWFFAQVDEGIVLEDDCLPSPDFFAFCSEMLDRYRHDTRVMAVCGSSYGGICDGSDSYGFSYFADIWGWATWRRAWQTYDGDMRRWPAFDRQGGLEALTGGRNATTAYWRRWFNATASGTIDTWDYQWIFTVMDQGGVACYPAYNLISNLGFRNDATHTTAASTTGAAARRHDPMPKLLRHPVSMARSTDLDLAIETTRRGIEQAQSAADRAAGGSVLRSLIEAGETDQAVMRTVKGLLSRSPAFQSALAASDFDDPLIEAHNRLENRIWQWARYMPPDIVRAAYRVIFDRQATAPEVAEWSEYLGQDLSMVEFLARLDSGSEAESLRNSRLRAVSDDQAVLRNR